MALDPNIPLGVRPFQGVNLLAIQENQRRQEQEARLAEQDKFEQEKYKAAREEFAQQQAEKKALGEAYQSAGGDRQELLNQMVRRGLAHKIPDAIKQFNELDKGALELGEIQARTDELKRRHADAQKQGVERIGALIEALGNDQNAWAIGRKAAIDGKWGSEEDMTPYDAAIAQDPSKIPAITAVMQKKAGAKSPDQMKASDLVQVVGPDGKPTWIEASQAPGKAAYEKPTTTSDRLVEVAGPGGKPVFVKQSEAAGMTPYVKPDKPAGERPARPATAAEKHTLEFYQRGQNASNNIKSIEPEIAKSGFWQQERMTRAPDFALSATQKAYVQAQREFAMAHLRRESGATITPAEYDSEAKTYFAQPGDTAAIIEQKRKAREVVLNGLRNASGNAYREYYGEEAPKYDPQQDTGGGGVKVKAPNGKTYTFPSQQAANEFKKKAGIP